MHLRAQSMASELRIISLTARDILFKFENQEQLFLIM